MIQGEKRTRLTVESILRRITEYDIFRHYLGRDMEINKAMFSPFRKENHPSFMVGNKYGQLYYIDFTDTSKRGDCFKLVMDLYNISMGEALMKIDRDFHLGIATEGNYEEFKRIKAEYKPPEELIGRRYGLIQVVTRKFTVDELKYWNQYHQDIQDLRDNHVYSIAKLYYNRRLFPLNDNELRFGYLYDNSWKIYRPFAERKNKWLPTNVPIHVMDGKENIVNCEKVFINKSKKDMMVIKKVFPTTCAVQSEGIACFTEENVKYLKDNSKEQILSFDSDTPGVANSQQITKLFGFGYCNVPRIYLPEIKDWADLAKNHGLDTIAEYLKTKGII